MAAAKSYKGLSPLDRLSGTTPIPAPVEEKPATKVDPKTTKDIEYKVNGEVKQKTKNGKYVGRPKTKTEKTKTINIAVPVSVLEKLDIVKLCYNNNLTLYINKLIEQDIEANYEKYENTATELSSLQPDVSMLLQLQQELEELQKNYEELEREHLRQQWVHEHAIEKVNSDKDVLIDTYKRLSRDKVKETKEKYQKKIDRLSAQLEKAKNSSPEN